MNRPAVALLGGLVAAIGVGSPALASYTCLVTGVPVVFGLYDPLSGTPADSAGRVDVTCTLLLGSSDAVSYSVSLSSGLGGSFAPRQMAGASGSLNYNLYRDASRSLIWGDGSGTTTTTSDSYTLGLTPVLRSYTVYGRIHTGQGAVAGAYADTVLVTLDF